MTDRFKRAFLALLAALAVGSGISLTGVMPAVASAAGNNVRGNAAMPWDADLPILTPPHTTGTKGLPKSARWAKDNHGIAPKPSKPGDVTTFGTVTREYGVGSLGLNNTGMDGNVYMGNPWVTFSDGDGGGGGHSIAQFAISSNSQQQILEWGWRKSYTGGNVKLFFSSWVNGVWQGYNNSAFVVTGTTPLPGDDVPAADLGTAKAMAIQWDGTQSCGGVTGRWYFAYAGSFKGYVCASNFPVGSGLRTGTSDFGQAFGEITMESNSTHAGFYCSDMGNGKQGSLGTGTAAYFGSLRLFGNATTNPPTDFFVYTSPASPLYGRISVFKASNRTFSYGGPGSNSTNTAVGTNGAC